MKKMTKIPLILLALVCTVAAFAGADTLTACGVPQILVDSIAPIAGVSCATTGLILPIGEQQTGLVIAYKNKKLIADEVMPIKKLDGKKLDFKYTVRTKGDGFTVQDTRVGRTSEPNIINLSGEEVSDFCVAHGLEDIIPQEDIDQLDDPTRFVNAHLQALADRIALGREMRVAGMVEDTNNYGSGLSHSYTDAQGIGASGFNIVDVLLEYLDKPLARPNRLGMGAAVWAKLRRDENILKALYPSGNFTGGVATREQVAELFEVDEIFVGESRVNTTKNPRNPTLARCWGSNIWAHYYEPLSNLTDGVAWGLTAQSGDRVTSNEVDKDIGLKGAQKLKVGSYLKELVVGKDAGFLLKNVIKTA